MTSKNLWVESFTVTSDQAGSHKANL